MRQWPLQIYISQYTENISLHYAPRRMRLPPIVDLNHSTPKLSVSAHVSSLLHIRFLLKSPPGTPTTGR